MGLAMSIVRERWAWTDGPGPISATDSAIFISHFYTMAYDSMVEGLEAMCITDLLPSSGWFFISMPGFFPITEHVYFNCLPLRISLPLPAPKILWFTL